MIKAHMQGFVHPVLFQRLRQGENFRAFSCEGRLLELRLEDGEILFIEADIEAGKWVYLFLVGKNLMAETEEERERRENEQRNRIQVWQQEEEARKKADSILMDLRRASTEKFHATLTLPISWTTGYKQVISGLREHSRRSDGTSAVTVGHILLLEDLDAGRLKRKTGQFLCTQSTGKGGANFTGEQELWQTDGKGQQYQARVTCVACLHIAKRWMIPPKEKEGTL